MEYQLNISGLHYEQIRIHLFPGDGKEAVAVALCGRFLDSEVQKILVSEIVFIPHNECIREQNFISWKTERIQPLLEKAAKYNMAILKIHSHPDGYDKFSSVDDKSDGELFPSVFGWTDSEDPHSSAVMLPSGRIFGRFFFDDNSTKEITRILVGGDSIKIWQYGKHLAFDRDIGVRTLQAFGEGTYNFLKNLRIAVIGCSGTGSPVIEQLMRLGVGKIVLVDPDEIELKNLNRIINSKKKHAIKRRLKVDILREAIEESDLGTKVNSYPVNLFQSLSCLRALAHCDILFGCVDSVDGRDLLNRLASFYIIPYFDIGVKLEADGNGNISKIVGTVNYLQPGKSSLMSRGLYDGEDLKAAGLYRQDPSSFADLVKNSYIKNINVNRPAVISINMMIASYAVNELLNRIHSYKTDSPEKFAQSTIDLTEGCFIHTPESDLEQDQFLKGKIGMGDRKLFLEMVELSNLPL